MIYATFFIIFILKYFSTLLQFNIQIVCIIYTYWSYFVRFRLPKKGSKILQLFLTNETAKACKCNKIGLCPIRTATHGVNKQITLVNIH